MALTYLILLRASELFSEDDGVMHAVYCLKGGYLAFYVGERKVEEGRRPGIATMEASFRGLSGDQERKGQNW